MQIRILQQSKGKYFVFQLVSFDFVLSFLYPNYRNLLQNIFSAIVMISALRVKFDE